MKRKTWGPSQHPSRNILHGHADDNPKRWEEENKGVVLVVETLGATVELVMETTKQVSMGISLL